MTENTTTKLVKNLWVGDRLRLTDPDGVARVTKVERQPIIQHVSGPCYEITLIVLDGPGKGEHQRLLHGAGEEVELAP